MALFGRQTPHDQAKARACADWLGRRNPLAIASLLLGVFSLTHLGTLVVDSIAGVVLGAVALRQLRSAAPAASSKPHGHRLAWIGILTSALSLVLATVLYTLPPRH